MEGCDTYLNTDLAKCHTCASDTVPVGSANDYDSCTACASPKKVKLDNNLAKVCVEVIEGCKLYKSPSNTECHTCGVGYNGDGSLNSYTACTCDKTAKLDELKAPVCVEDIENCLEYSSSTAGKCYTCVEGITGTGGVANARDACPCTEGSKTLATKADKS